MNSTRSSRIVLRIVAGILVFALLLGGALATGMKSTLGTPDVVAQAMTPFHAVVAGAAVAPHRSASPLTVGLPTGCNPNITNTNTALGPNNGNGLGDTRFYTYDTLQLDDRANLKANVANGNLVVHIDLLHIKGTLLDLDVAAFYNVQGSGTSEIGDRWLLSPGADVKLVINSGSSITFVAPGGYQTTFGNPNGSGVFQDQPGLDATLIHNSDGTYALNFHKTGECFSFNSSGQFTSDTEKNGHQLDFAYNGSGLLSSITDTQGRVTSFSYNSFSLLTTITDPIGRTVQFGYTNNGCLTCVARYLGSITDATGKSITFGYDRTSGALTSLTDPRGNTTSLSYSSNRVNTLTDATAAQTTFAYSVSGTGCVSPTVANQVTDANNHTTTYCYSGDTLQVQTAFDALGHKRSSSYTTNYNVASLTDPLTNLSTFTWSSDGKSNLLGVTDATGANTAFGYGSGNPYLPTNVTDPQGTVLAYTYDSPGNLTSVKDNTGGKNQLLDTYVINNASNGAAPALYGTLASATNGNGKKTTFGYDANGNLTSVTPPSGGVLGGTSLTYDGVSRVATVTDGKGQVTSFTYDKDDRITKITYSGGATVNYTYDGNGNITSEVDANGTTSFTYDKDNRELTKSQPNSFQITYTYDPVGNLATLTDPGGTVTYGYNAVNDLTTLTEPNGTSQVTFQYDNDDRRTQTNYPNGVTQTIGYDNGGRETSVVGKHSSTTLTSFTYCYVNADPCPATSPSGTHSTNLRAWVKDASGSKTSYTYDTQNRLTEAKMVNGGTTISDYAYTYDAASNLTRQVDTNGGNSSTTTYTVDADNAVTSATTDGISQNFGYDGNGNMTSWTGGWSLSYNSKNQTTSITNGGQSESYSYSGPDQQELLTLSSANGTIQFANSALGETYQQGTDSSVTRAFARDNRGGLVSKSPTAGEYYFYLFDGLGSVAAVTDPSGNVAASYQYDPYGNVTSQTGLLYNPFQYASGWQSDITNFTHFGQRWYAPTPFYGRWTQQDPVAGSLGNPTSQCRYAYANDNPINLTDASGESTVGCVISVLAGVVGSYFTAAAIAPIIAPTLFALAAGGPFAILGAGALLLGAGIVVALPTLAALATACFGL